MADVIIKSFDHHRINGEFLYFPRHHGDNVWALSTFSPQCVNLDDEFSSLMEPRVAPKPEHMIGIHPIQDCIDGPIPPVIIASLLRDNIGKWKHFIHLEFGERRRRFGSWRSWS